MSELLNDAAYWLDQVGQTLIMSNVITFILTIWYYPLRLAYWIFNAMDGGIINFAVTLAATVVGFFWGLITGNYAAIPTATQVMTHPVSVFIISILRYIDTFLPVSELFSVITYVCLFFCVCTLIRLVLLVYSLVPVIGRNT